MPYPVSAARGGKNSSISGPPTFDYDFTGMADGPLPAGLSGEQSQIFARA